MTTTVKPSGWAKAPSGIYQVSGTQILDPDGNVFFPFGANTAVKMTPYSYVFEWEPSDTDTISGFTPSPGTPYGNHIAAAKDWGWNFLRVNTVPWNTDGEGPTPGGDPAGTADLLDEGMTQLLDAGFVVMPASHWPVPGSNPVWGDTDDLRVRAFWTRAIELWGSYPNFWINPFNEPHNLEGASGVATQITLYTEWLGFLRGLGYTGPIVWDIVRQGQAIDDVALGYYDTFMGLDDNMILSWHGYGVATGSVGSNGYPAYSVTKAANAGLAAIASGLGHCILLGEFGETYNGTTSTGSVAGQENVVEWALTDDGAEALDIGMCVWHSGHDDYTLIASDAGPFWSYSDVGSAGRPPTSTQSLSAFGTLVRAKGVALDLAGDIVVP